MSFGPNMIKIAHRGYCVPSNGYHHRYKDNSVESISNAIHNRFDMIEIDIQLCKSGEIVLTHDDKINGSYVKDMDYKELKKLNIIKLEEFYDIIGIHKIKIYLDVKGIDIEIANKLLTFINMYNIDLEYLYIGSFNRKILHILKLAPINLKLGYITGTIFTTKELDMMTYGLEFLSIYWKMIDEDTYKYCKKKNIKVFLWTLDNTKYLHDFYKLKNLCDGIVTNVNFTKL